MRAKVNSRSNLKLIQFGTVFNFDPTSVKANLFFLIASFAVLIAGIGIPLTREMTLLILDENNVVEVLTFVVFLIGGGFGLNFCKRMFKEKENFLNIGFYFTFSVFLILIGMEEISWGQQFFGFETPETFRPMNEQGETTIHNIKGMSGNSEYLRLFYGIGGVIGVFLLRNRTFRKIAAPAFLLPWFGLIVLHSKVDVFNDIVPIQKHFDALVSELAEFVELLIAVSAFIYIYFNSKKYPFKTNK